MNGFRYANWVLLTRGISKAESKTLIRASNIHNFLGFQLIRSPSCVIPSKKDNSLFTHLEDNKIYSNPSGVVMGDHFVFLVDRLLTESTLEAAIESRNPSKNLGKDDTVIDCSSSSSHVDFTPKKLVECRICQDEDFDSNMETPCSCCGSLKYAHRRCVQRWCNEKGDTMCEICHQQFKPGYTAPSRVFRLGGIPLNLRGHWHVARRDINNNPRLITVVSPDRNFLDQDYDEYVDPTSRSFTCFRSVAAIFVVLLFLRHSLPAIVNGTWNYSFPMFVLWFLRTSAIVVPIYIMMRGWWLWYIGDEDWL